MSGDLDREAELLHEAAVEMGRLGGLAKSARKAAAARQNILLALAARAQKRADRGMVGLPVMRTPSGQYRYEVSPGRWVSRQRVNQINNPKAHAARNAAQKLSPKPCEVCGTLQGVQRHHDDYEKPLEVRWLCRKHHAEADKARRQQEAR